MAASTEEGVAKPQEVSAVHECDCLNINSSSSSGSPRGNSPSTLCSSCLCAAVRIAIATDGLNMTKFARRLLPQLRACYKTPPPAAASLIKYSQQWLHGKRDRRFVVMEPVMRSWLAQREAKKSLEGVSIGTKSTKACISGAKQGQVASHYIRREGKEEKKDEERRVVRRKGVTDKRETKRGSKERVVQNTKRHQSLRNVASIPSGVACHAFSPSSMVSGDSSAATSILPLSMLSSLSSYVLDQAARSENMEEKRAGPSEASINAIEDAANSSKHTRAGGACSAPPFVVTEERVTISADCEMKEFFEKKVGLTGDQCEFYLEKCATAIDGIGLTFQDLMDLKLYGTDCVVAFLYKWVFVPSTDFNVSLERMADLIRVKRYLEMSQC